MANGWNMAGRARFMHSKVTNWSPQRDENK
jgi:hypothetical protein